MKARVLQNSFILMASLRSLLIGIMSHLVIDEESSKDSPLSKKPINTKLEGKFAVNWWKFVAAFGLYIVFCTGLFCIYIVMPVLI